MLVHLVSPGHVNGTGNALVVEAISANLLSLMLGSSGTVISSRHPAEYYSQGAYGD